MPRSYRHIQQYEKEILKLKEEGYTKREIGKKLELSIISFADTMKNNEKYQQV